MRWAANPFAYVGDHVGELSSYVLRIEIWLRGDSVLVKDLSAVENIHLPKESYVTLLIHFVDVGQKKRGIDARLVFHLTATYAVSCMEIC